MTEVIRAVAKERAERMSKGPVPPGVQRSVNASFREPKRKAAP